MDMIDVIKGRRSIRRFNDKPIPEEVLADLIDCARLAPTAINIQPWLIGCVTDKVQLERLANMANNGKFIKDSAACFAIFCEKDKKYYLEDGCAATMNIITAAAAKGIGTCWVAGDKKEYVEAVRTLLEVPDTYTLVSLIAAGYANETPKPAKKDPKNISFRDRYK
ncbi:MAG TPA: nitroreductase family protein [Methanocella sp.]|nr:nitroreductase family protein [Methanocella sp.]